jgi:DNA mismatch endonuclease (patch repair protein)
MTSIRKRAPVSRSAVVRRVMQANKPENTSPEMVLRRALHSAGLRYRVHVRPDSTVRCVADVVFRAQKVCVFVDGCFWHGCPTHFSLPKTNSAWWREKIEDIQERDKRQTSALTARGWIVIRFWEHDVLKSPRRCVNIVARRLRARGKS